MEKLIILNGKDFLANLNSTEGLPVEDVRTAHRLKMWIRFNHKGMIPFGVHFDKLIYLRVVVRRGDAWHFKTKTKKMKCSMNTLFE